LASLPKATKPSAHADSNRNLDVFFIV